MIRIYKNKKFFLHLQRLSEKTMKKTIILSILLCLASATSFAQDNANKVQHLDYNGFIKNIWDFEKNPNEFIFKGKVPAIVDFYADWCGPCRRVAPIMEKLANEFDGQLVIYKINVDQAKDLASVFQVSSIPTVLFIPKEGKPMMQVGAMSENDYRKVINEQLLK